MHPHSERVGKREVQAAFFHLAEVSDYPRQELAMQGALSMEEALLLRSRRVDASGMPSACAAGQCSASLCSSFL
jgi:hypothetical protein